jgi:FAD/FMN-containing dehydrogenase
MPGDGRPCRHARLEEFGWLIWSHSCGLKGCPGVITSVTVKLHPIPEHVVAAVVFESLTGAAQAVAA